MHIEWQRSWEFVHASPPYLYSNVDKWSKAFDSLRIAKGLVGRIHSIAKSIVNGDLKLPTNGIATVIYNWMISLLR